MKVRHLSFDVVAIILFAVFARLAHQTPDMPFGVKGVTETAWPFLLGTFVALLLVMRDSNAKDAVGASWKSGLLVWVLSVATGLGIWGLRHGAVPHWSFMIVASTMSALLLFGWRGIRRLAVRRQN